VKIGIRQWVEQRIISGARVAFDPRTTAEVDSTRDPQNYRSRDRRSRVTSESNSQR